MRRLARRGRAGTPAGPGETLIPAHPRGHSADHSNDPEELTFTGSAGNRLAAEGWGAAGAPPVLLLHGGGQTRHAWSDTARLLAEAGLRAIALDHRGHGDSEWVADGDYSFHAIADDIAAVLRTLDRPTVLVGASLGGIGSMLAAGERVPGLVRAVILVDVGLSMNRAGVARILEFMSAHPDGFADLQEAADAVAAYLPHRERPRDPSGLIKNLRESADGRLRWHWDPRMLDHASESGHIAEFADVERAAARIAVPVLLVRGGLSEVMDETSVRHTLQVIPRADYVNVAHADHMVAGDRNDAFTAAVIDYLAHLPVATAGADD
ncbi:alpha/beta fold hydrolase [Lentisalinibacter sediminis]|uniref:alpha/beta fold hydrolase n=1 Tax=Lentisalinibacter sediminis TaxID=2992237 RepID=UPI0038665226